MSNIKSFQAPLEYDYLFKIIIIGNSGVGKSSLLLRFTDRIFEYSHVSTIGVDFKIQTIQLDNKIIKMQLWDTAGNERFRTITTSYYRGSHGVCIVFDLTDKQSFENINSWFTEIEKYASNNIKKILVGNKCDISKDREISYKEANEFANKLNIPYIETSAKDSINVQELFINLAKTLKEDKLKKEYIIPEEKVSLIGKDITIKSSSSCC
jgi:Ras-related protein Rab-1A